jgi:hypothetical protein
MIIPFKQHQLVVAGLSQQIAILNDRCVEHRRDIAGYDATLAQERLRVGTLTQSLDARSTELAEERLAKGVAEDMLVDISRIMAENYFSLSALRRIAEEAIYPDGSRATTLVQKVARLVVNQKKGRK